jgi:hypothetical protein
MISEGGLKMEPDTRARIDAACCGTSIDYECLHKAERVYEKVRESAIMRLVEMTRRK